MFICQELQCVDLHFIKFSFNRESIDASGENRRTYVVFFTRNAQMLPRESKADAYMRRLFFAELYWMLSVNLPNHTSTRVPLYCTVVCIFLCGAAVSPLCHSDDTEVYPVRGGTDICSKVRSRNDSQPATPAFLIYRLLTGVRARNDVRHC